MAERHFRIDHADGHHSFATVPHGRRRRDFGVPAEAVRVPRLPEDHERHVPGEGFVKDEEAAAREERRRRFRAMDKADLMLLIERLGERMAAVETKLDIAPAVAADAG